MGKKQKQNNPSSIFSTDKDGMVLQYVDAIFPIRSSDWFRIKDFVNNLSEKSTWLSIVFSILMTITIAIFSNCASTIDGKISLDITWYLVLAVLASIGVFVWLLIVSIHNKSYKSVIINEFQSIENTFQRKDQNNDVTIASTGSVL